MSDEHETLAAHTGALCPLPRSILGLPLVMRTAMSRASSKTTAVLLISMTDSTVAVRLTFWPVLEARPKVYRR